MAFDFIAWRRQTYVPKKQIELSEGQAENLSIVPDF
jgi:hypothetical protein